jgi:hypothetical protein
VRARERKNVQSPRVPLYKTFSLKVVSILSVSYDIFIYILIFFLERKKRREEGEG